MKIQILTLMVFSLLACHNKCPEKNCPKNLDCSTQKLPILIGVNGEKEGKNTADIKVEATIDSINVDEFVLSGVISATSTGNNDAHDVKVMVMLPAEVNIKSYNGPDSCLVLSQSGMYENKNVQAGYITYFVDHLAREHSFAIKVVTTKPVKAIASSPSFAIFASNLSPEDNYSNNYWSWR